MNYLMLCIGLLFLIKGADLLVGSASKIAKRLNYPSFMIGLFVVSLGTSAPEASIGIFSGIQGTNLITLGDVVGSNIVNITIVIGITAMVLPLQVDSMVTKREMPLSILIQTILIAMVYTGLVLSRVESAILLVGMLAFLVYIFMKSKQLSYHEKPDTLFEDHVYEYLEDESVLIENGKENIKQANGQPVYILVLLFCIGLLGLIGGAALVVNNAVEIARTLGLSEEFIGLTVVAFGTSLPELVTCLVAAIKKEEDIAIGNVVGSNIFNILFVLGISGFIHPIQVEPSVLLDLFVMLATSILILIPTYFYGRISKRSGFVFVSFYSVYLAYKLSGLG